MASILLTKRDQLRVRHFYRVGNDNFSTEIGVKFQFIEIYESTLTANFFLITIVLR